MAQTGGPMLGASADDLRDHYFIGSLEADVLRSVSAIGHPAAVREICDWLSRDGYFAYQGVLNCANRLARKGLLVRSQRGLAYQYGPSVDPFELAAHLALDVIRALGADRDRVVCRVLGLDPQRDAPKIARLRAETRALPLDPKIATLLAHLAGARRGGARPQAPG